MAHDTRAIDISVALGKGSIDYPGDTPYARNYIMSLANGDFCDLSRLEMSTHSGTHLDAPAHFLIGGKTIDAYPPERFLASAVVIEVDDPRAVEVTALRDLQLKKGDALLFKTENSRTGRCCDGVFRDDYTYVSREAAEACVELGVSLVGIDYISLERYGDTSFSAHRALLSRDVLVLEGLDLRTVTTGRYALACLPLRLEGAEASPVRAVLRREV